MTFLNSLTRKFVFISIMLLLFLSVFIYSVFYYTHHLRNDTARINVISQLRFRSFEMAWLVQKIIEKDVATLPPQVRESYVRALRHNIDVYDQLIGDLTQGSREEGIGSPYVKFQPLINNLSSQWNKRQRPLLIKVTELPADTEEKVLRDLLQDYDAGIYQYAGELDSFAGLIEAGYRNEIKKFETFIFYVLGIFIIAAAFFVVYTHYFVVQPVKRLRDSAKEVEDGNFGVSVEVKTVDELGELSKTFNAMSTALARIFSEAKKRANDILSLNKASNKILGITDTKRLYSAICENVLNIFGLDLVWIGLVKEGSFEVKPVAQAGETNDYLSSVTVTWDDTPTGNGPAGLAIKSRLPQTLSPADTEPSYGPWADHARSRGLKSVMAAPLVCSGNEVIGTINFYSADPGFFSEETKEMLQVFANQAAAVIDNARMVEELEKTVRKRTRQLEDAKMISESVNLSKSNFIANMSHELRTPLNVIIGFSEALSSGIYGEINSEHAEYLRLILDSGLHLLSLVDSILELATIDTGTMVLNYSECSITDILQSSVNMFREKAKKHRIDLHVELGEGLLTFVIDENKIRYVLVTLITNAIKNSPDGGAVSLSARRVLPVTQDAVARQSETISRKSGADFIEIAVHDMGPAVSDEQQKSLFIPFESAESPLSGSGEVLRINLALCKRFIEVHGGNIRIEGLPSEGPLTAQAEKGCQVETGNRFVFVLPMRPSNDKIINNTGN